MFVNSKNSLEKAYKPKVCVEISDKNILSQESQKL